MINQRGGRNHRPPSALARDQMSFALAFTHDHNFTVYDASTMWGCVDDCCSFIDTGPGDVDHVKGYCGDDLEKARLRTTLVFAAIMPMAIVMPLIACWLCALGCRARGNHRASVTPHVRTANNSEVKLVAAEQAAARLYSRVQRSLFVFGWCCFVISITPVFVNFLGFVDITPVSGIARLFFAGFVPVGLSLLALAIRPTDSAAIRRAITVLLLIMTFLSIFFTLVGIRQVRKLAFGGIGYLFCGMVVCPVVIAILLSTFTCCHCRCSRRATTEEERDGPMPSRQQLLRLWLALRFFFLACIIPVIQGTFHNGVGGPRWDGGLRSGYVGGCFIIAIMGLAVILPSPERRGDVVRWLGAMGRSNVKEQEAASVAALLGGKSVSEALVLAVQHFRALPLGALTKEEMANNRPDPAMHAKTTKADLGAVSAFVSHSWSDPGNAKYEVLQLWASRDGEGEKSDIWLDKACIDQTNIDANLMALPVFLSGCRSLLVLAGPTYSSRLWCVMELFVFLRMGGARDDIAVRLLEDGDSLVRQLERFDAGEAKCFLNRDRQRLWAVIESSFGTFAPFNKQVRAVFADNIASAAGERYRAE